MIQIILITILIIIGIYFLNENNDILNSNILKNNISNTNNNTNKFDNAVQTLMRQSARWSLAAQQDENPLIAVLHANYGAGYLWAVKDIASSEDVKRTTGINLKKFEDKIVSVQDETTKKLAQLCPEYAGTSDKYLRAIAGEG